jgi:organic radical activating enzyme
MAWNHQFIDPTGRVKPCCRFAEKFRPVENNLNNKTLSDIFYGEWMESVRDDMSNDRQVAGCVRCYEEESAGKKSLRQRYNSSSDLPIDKLVDFNNPTIRWIELAISNDCNLACRMCDSRYAWKWYDEEKSHFGKTFNIKQHSKSDISNIDPFIESLVHIKFTGGEPLITPDQWIVLDKLIETRDCSEIFINYSTNCTIYPKEKWVEKWRKFKNVEFAMSFDTCSKEEWEYIRWPSKYETAESVTKRFLELKYDYGFNVFNRSTISILNVWNLPETLEWWYKHDISENVNINPTHLTYPEYLSITVLPQNLKEMVIHKLSSYKSIHKKINQSIEYIINVMKSRDDTHLLPELRCYLNKTDEYRSQNFVEVYPMFKEIFA